MTIQEKIRHLIESSDLSNLDKLMSLGFIERADNQYDERKRILTIIELMDSGVRVDDVILSTDDLIIYKVVPKSPFDKISPYRIIYKADLDTTWIRSVYASESLDEAYLMFLEEKSGNGGFAKFATKMLNNEK